MRVIIVSDYAFVNGGAAKVALESARALADSGVKVHVFAAIGEPEAYLTEHPDITVVSLGQRKVTEGHSEENIIRGLWNRAAEASFSKLLDAHDSSDTVIHIHSWRDALTLSIVPQIVRRGFKFVITGHDYGIACPIAGFFNHREQSICRRRGLSVACLTTSCTGGSFTRKSWFALRHSLQIYLAGVPQKVRHFISLGELNEEVIAPYLPASAKIHRLANPIPIKKEARITAEENQGFVFVGRYSPEKAPQFAAEAARLIGAPISFLGMGPMVDDIRRVNPDAEILGWKTSEQTQSYLRSRRALVFPSIWFEGQPLVIDEAAALGLPVICSNASAGAAAVESRNAGEVYQVGSIEALASAMERFRDPLLVKKYSESSYESYWSNPQTIDRHIRELLAIYSEVLAD